MVNITVLISQLQSVLQQVPELQTVINSLKKLVFTEQEASLISE